MEPASATARLHTVEEVMERLRVGRSTAFGLIGSRQLRSVKVGRRRLVSEAALVEFIENLDRQTLGLEVFGQGRPADAR
jgi:excisionase family DNA binding protein